MGLIRVELMKAQPNTDSIRVMRPIDDFILNKNTFCGTRYLQFAR